MGVDGVREVHPSLLDRGIDLVAVGELCLFMFEDDNLYRIVVPDSAKKQSLSGFQKRVRQQGYTPSPVTPENVEHVGSARHGVFLFLYHLWRRRIPFTVLDIGSFVGSFSLRIASCARTFGERTQVIAFDPTDAGALMNYNIELNGLGDWVRHEDLAIGEVDGLAVFDCRAGHSDSSHVRGDREEGTGVARRGVRERAWSFVERPLRAARRSVRATFGERARQSRKSSTLTYSIIARSNQIQTYLNRGGIESDLFVKIDAEGMDPIIVRQLMTLLHQRRISIIFEFAPGQFEKEERGRELLDKLSAYYYVFDMFYSPNPTRFRLVRREELAALASEVREQRRYGYTDLFLLDKRIPDCAGLVERLSSLRELPDVYWLAWPPEEGGL